MTSTKTERTTTVDDNESYEERAKRAKTAFLATAKPMYSKPVYPTHMTFEVEHLKIAPTTENNRNGGKYATICYGPKNTQVHFQLGASPKDALRCPFGFEGINPEYPGSQPSIKLELGTESLQLFAKSLDQSILQTVRTNMMPYFKKELSEADMERYYIPITKPGKEGYSSFVKLKIVEESFGKKTPTSVLVAQWKGDKITTPVNGSLSDVARGCTILPIVRLSGGLWGLGPQTRQFGISLEAAQLLVIKSEEESSNGSGNAFAMGGVEIAEPDVMTEPAEQAEDE